MIVAYCIFGFVGVVLLIGGGEYAKAPPGSTKPRDGKVFGWFLRLLGALLIFVSIASIIRSLVD
jgi:hypothetical protein